MSAAMQRTRLAVVLFNLGGPDTPAAVRPFLLNLFSDPAILRVPFFVRPLLARIIAAARTKPATANYAILGGGSPLLGLTQEQARALEAALPEFDVRCFVAMRYWHPFSDAVAQEVRDWAPDEVVLLPLYPQYSTTTTGSSLTAWREAAARADLVAPVTTLCCYHADPGYVAATAAGVRRAYDAALAALDGKVPLRVLFSAHGLPETIVKQGDPYQFQSGAHRGGHRARAGDPGAGLVGLLPVARHAAEMARSQHRGRDRQGGRGQGRRAGGADRLRVGAFRNAGRAGRGVSRAGGGEGRARLFPCAGAERRPRLHREPGRPGPRQPRARPRPVQLGRRPHLPQGPSRLPACPCRCCAEPVA